LGSAAGWEQRWIGAGAPQLTEVDLRAAGIPA